MRYLLTLLVILLPSVGLTDYREEFRKEFLTKPWAGVQAPKDVCVECHASEMMKPEIRVIPSQWEMSWHYQNGVSCHDCHGGDPQDEANAMSPERGFVGVPKYAAVPEFCGKCHVGILKNFLESGHGKTLKASGKGPNCVTCHGVHNIQKASINIINEQLCTKCHSYERVKIMKQALFVTENKIHEVDKDLKKLKSEGIYTEDEDKDLFSTQAEFRTLFHTENVSLVRGRTDGFIKKLNQIEVKMQKTFEELRFRRNFSGFLMLLFIGLGVGLLILMKSPKE